jgi:hypothetical protein
MKLKKTFAFVVTLAMAFSMIAATTLTVSADETTAFFEFDKRTGGWWVHDTSRGANGGAHVVGSNHGHRVQLTPYETEEDDLPPKSDHEVLLFLPPETHFTDIATVRAFAVVDWDEWKEEDYLDLILVTQTNIHTWKAETAEVDDLKISPTLFNAPETYFKRPNGMEIFADNLIVIATTWSAESQRPVPPMSVLINLIDFDGNVIVLVCPDCDGTPCVCLCPGANGAEPCGKTVIDCECFCEECEEAPCKCCPLCGDPECEDEECVEDAEINDPPPPPPPPAETTAAATTPAVVTTAAAANVGAGTASGTPKGGVTFALIPVLIAGISVAVSRKSKK